MDQIDLRANYKNDTAVSKIAEFIKPFLSRRTVIFCVGTDKCIGDCLGPLVGTLLTKSGFPYPVIGTLEDPAHAVNLESKIKQVNEEYPGCFIIAVDACLGYSKFVGDIQLKMGPVHPGKGVGKALPYIGDVSLVGVVDSTEVSDFFTIRSIRLSMVMDIAETIANALLKAVHEDNANNRQVRTKWYRNVWAAVKQVAAAREE